MKTFNGFRGTVFAKMEEAHERQFCEGTASLAEDGQ
jgi:hypothetical protein